MKLWTADIGKFWLRAIPALALLFLVGALCHTSINPPRWYPEDWLILVPMGVCAWVSIREQGRIDLATRGVFGLLQAFILLAVYENEWRDTALRSSMSGLFIFLGLISTMYASAFGLVTHQAAHRNPATPDLSRCQKCGYLLKGLEQPRCPECGAAFDPALLQINRLDDGSRDNPESVCPGAKARVDPS